MANTYRFDLPSIIATKRDGAELSPDAIDWLIEEYTGGRIGEEQVAALLMAIYLRGMNSAETKHATENTSIRPPKEAGPAPFLEV